MSVLGSQIIDVLKSEFGYSGLYISSFEDDPSLIDIEIKKGNTFVLFNESQYFENGSHAGSKFVRFDGDKFIGTMDVGVVDKDISWFEKVAERLNQLL